MYNARADNQHKKHRREQRFSTESALDFVNAPITAEEIASWEEDSPDLSLNGIRKAIKRKRLTIFKDTAPEEDRFQPMPQPKDLGTLALAEKSASAINARRPYPELSATPALDQDMDEDLDEVGDLDGNNTVVSDADLVQLHSTIFFQESSGGPQPDLTEEGLAEEADRILLGSDTTYGTAHAFIDIYAAIRDETRPVRDETSRQFICQTPGCPYRTPSVTLIRDHQRRCTPETFLAQQSRLTGYPCDQTPGCPYIARTRTKLTNHKKRCNPSLVAKNMLKDFTPPKPIHCATPGCTYKSLSPHHLKRHESTCTEEKVAEKLRRQMA
jgi:hypothetical protein